MTALVEWAREHTCRLFPMSAQYSRGNGSEVEVNWQAEPPGSGGRQRHGAALQFDQDVIDAVYVADSAELARIGGKLTDVVSRWLAGDDIACLSGDRLVIPVGNTLLNH
ncbi:hypothetical protein CupriaWKF_20370 [Cupriavidus sp. WKF15]|uniref:hypothetical protein n=1 Tax=Cupriavidus sp. WKF15 TaxID=3032282 RepID=UPI0023E3427C|nr:hypothetical protein [Cupriavidus sp. WKF15]WER49499.1 hypothetical protein CupriaWKF_20370 [Cupriavidus sp. WKF15]